MNLFKRSALVAVALVGAGALSLAAAQPADVPMEPDWLWVVGVYPGLGTLDAQNEVFALSWLQQARTGADVARTAAEINPTLSSWADVFQPALKGGDHPMTEALLAQASQDLRPVLDALKVTFARPRPFVSFPGLTPALPQDTSFSYPCGDAAQGALYAQIIAQFSPSNRNTIMERGNLIGTDQVMAGVHWPSDAAAGKRLGLAFATFWINQPGHRDQIKACCRAEWCQR